MSIFSTAKLAVCLVLTACAAEHLEARDPSRGPASASAATAPISRPTDLATTEKQLAPPAKEVGQPKAKPPATYTCPMHPEVQASEPGACPKCGMTLVPKP